MWKMLNCAFFSKRHLVALRNSCAAMVNQHFGFSPYSIPSQQSGLVMSSSWEISSTPLKLLTDQDLNNYVKQCLWSLEHVTQASTLVRMAFSVNQKYTSASKKLKSGV